jgi:hypothetical protein
MKRLFDFNRIVSCTSQVGAVWDERHESIIVAFPSPNVEDGQESILGDFFRTSENDAKNFKPTVMSIFCTWRMLFVYLARFFAKN